MAKDTKVSLGVEEGQKLLIGAAFIHAPEKLGDSTFSNAERNGIASELASLFTELKAYSPLMQSRGGAPGRRFVFGPEDCWEPILKDGKIVDHGYVHPDRQIQVRLSPNALNGAVWVLIMGLHPSSPTVAKIMDQEEILWPIARKLRKAEAIQKEIGVDKAVHRRFDDDPDRNEEQPDGTPGNGEVETAGQSTSRGV